MPDIDLRLGLIYDPRNGRPGPATPPQPSLTARQLVVPTLSPRNFTDRPPRPWLPAPSKPPFVIRSFTSLGRTMSNTIPLRSRASSDIVAVEKHDTIVGIVIVSILVAVLASIALYIYLQRRRAAAKANRRDAEAAHEAWAKERRERLQQLREQTYNESKLDARNAWEGRSLFLGSPWERPSRDPEPSSERGRRPEAAFEMQHLRAGIGSTHVGGRNKTRYQPRPLRDPEPGPRLEDVFVVGSLSDSGDEKPR
ncbi:hypothetical protein BDY21DRAFT_378762 [Lineolata rhizophorae]|uniref:Uncharacterized protein n=1 Tax=Lineolata rhizophorae TaxID=578093 RepID=A0A6A6P324_9PEZI|nr:hypothetical protein BDY21DRAFT_378762 [Lineolata rhizophorae]